MMSPIEVSNIFDVNLAWLSEAEAFKGRNYIAKIGTQKISCQITISNTNLILIL